MTGMNQAMISENFLLQGKPAKIYQDAQLYNVCYTKAEPKNNQLAKAKTQLKFQINTFMSYSPQREYNVTTGRYDHNHLPSQVFSSAASFSPAGHKHTADDPGPPLVQVSEHPPLLMVQGSGGDVVGGGCVVGWGGVTTVVILKVIQN